MIAPDFIFFLDISAEVALKRGTYGNEVYENYEFQEKVQSSFHKVVKSNWYHIDGTRTIDTINREICLISFNLIDKINHVPLSYI